MARMVVIADDLTGAADCAAASAAIGYGTHVILYSPRDEQFEPFSDSDIISIDANTRCLPSAAASELTTQLVHQCDSRSGQHPAYVLFKKIDSTLRGNVAAEIAALLRARRSIASAGNKSSVLMSPALPAQGRTTVGGRLLVHGIPLEETDLWKTETREAQSDILQFLRNAGLSCVLIGTCTVRSGQSSLRQAISKSAQQADVVVCDAETDSDLQAIADASLREPALSAFVGSAGLATQISLLMGLPQEAQSSAWTFAPGSTLFLIGSASSVSREQARILESADDLTTFHISPADFQNPATMQASIVQSLGSMRDLLLVLEGDEHCSNYNEHFPNALATIVAECAPLLGGLVATGGETARAALDALAIRRLRVLGEVEAGLPFSMTDHWIRPLPVITKAGAFGSPQALAHCRDFLRNLERVPLRSRENHPLLNHES